MNVHSNEIEQRRNAIALAAWENEGGAPGRDAGDHQYGRRIESDRSWTVYHVFTGVPAHADGQTMTGLSQTDATSGMVTLNRRSERHRSERITTLAGKASCELAACQP